MPQQQQQQSTMMPLQCSASDTTRTNQVAAARRDGYGDNKIRRGSANTFSLLDRWKAVADRFDTARANYDFNTGTFRDELGKDFGSTTSQSGSIQLSSSVRSNTGEKVPTEQSLSGSADFGSGDMMVGGTGDDADEIVSQLNIEHSQRLVRRSSKAVVSMGGNNQSFLRKSGSKIVADSFQLDQLAIHDMSVVGRKSEEQEIIEKGYNDPDISLVNIVGKSGIGKSVLAQTAIRNHIRNLTTSQDHNRPAGIVCSGKFELYNQAKPYQAIVQALGAGEDGFLSQIRSDKGRFRKIQKELFEKLGEDLHLLVELIPSFEALLPKKTIDEDNDMDDWRLPRDSVPQGKSSSTTRRAGGSDITMRATQIQNVFVDFLGVVCTKEHPVVFILDDIQWAGQAALALIASFLNEGRQKLKHLFLLTTCREGYLLDDSDMKSDELIQFFKKHDDRTYQITIGGLEVEAVQIVINTLIRMDDSTETKGLAEIVHQKTKGNPFFVVQFMRSLVEEELLVYEAGQMRWIWHLHAIETRNVTKNVSEIVSRRLKNLNGEALLVAQVASCLSRTFELDTLQFVLEGLKIEFETEWDSIVWPDDILTSLGELSREGILESSYRTSFSFAHDQLQEAAFGLIPDDREVKLQVAIGKRLIQGLDSLHRDQFLLTAGELCGRGVDQMDNQEKKTFAFWSFLAGDTALKQGAFQLSMKFFDRSYDCLGDKAFDDDPELALALYSSAAEAAYCTSNFEKADRYIAAAAAQNDISIEQFARLAIVKMNVQCGRREFEAAATTFCKAIKRLGKGRMVKNPSTVSVLYHAMKTSKMLKKYDQTKLMSLAECTDSVTSAALSCQRAVFASLYVANPNLFIITACKSMEWSLQYGVSASSPVGFCSVGMLLISLKDNQKALEVGESALALCEKYNYREALAVTVALVFGFIRHWSRPMHQFVSPMRYGIEVGNRLGCISDVAVAMNTFGILMILTSAEPLDVTVTELEIIRQKLRDGKQDDQICFTECNLQFAQKLAYVQSDDSTSASLDGEVMNEVNIRAIAKQNNDVILNAFVDYFKMQLCIYFGKPGEACKHGERVVDFGFKYAQGTHMVPRCTFMIGLANILCFKEHGASKYLRTGKAMLKRLRTWTKQKNPNVLHMLQLLDAELTFATYKKRESLKHIEEKYKKAIASSKRMGFRLDFALFNELYALFQLEAKKDDTSAAFYMKQAYGEYESYGALNKAAYVERTYASIMAINN